MSVNYWVSICAVFNCIHKCALEKKVRWIAKNLYIRKAICLNLYILSNFKEISNQCTEPLIGIKIMDEFIMASMAYVKKVFWKRKEKKNDCNELSNKLES